MPVRKVKDPRNNSICLTGNDTIGYYDLELRMKHRQTVHFARLSSLLSYRRIFFETSSYSTSSPTQQKRATQGNNTKKNKHAFIPCQSSF